MDRARTTVAPASFAVQLQYDSTHRFLHLMVDRCVLRTKADVASYVAHCTARIRTFELPADMLVRYDRFEVLGDAVRELSERRRVMADTIGGRLYRYTGATRPREVLAVSSVPPVPGSGPIVMFDSYDAAVAQLLADRGVRPRRASYATLQRRVDNLRSGAKR